MQAEGQAGRTAPRRDRDSGHTAERPDGAESRISGLRQIGGRLSEGGWGDDPVKVLQKSIQFPGELPLFLQPSGQAGIRNASALVDEGVQPRAEPGAVAALQIREYPRPFANHDGSMHGMGVLERRRQLQLLDRCSGRAQVRHHFQEMLLGLRIRQMPDRRAHGRQPRGMHPRRDIVRYPLATDRTRVLSFHERRRQ